MNLNDLYAQPIGSQVPMTVTIKHLEPPVAVNTQYSEGKQQFYVNDGSVQQDVKFTMWLTKMEMAFTPSYVGRQIAFIVKVKSYKGHPEFEAKWSQANNQQTTAAPPYNPPVQQMPAAQAQNFPPPQTAKLYSGPAVQPTNQRDYAAEERAKQLKIDRECASKVAVEWLRLNADAEWEDLIATSERLVDYYRNGPPNSGAGVNNYEEEHPDEVNDIPF